MKIGKEFKRVVKILIPIHYNDIVKGIEDNFTKGEIDDIVFRRSEYLGGMANVIITLIERGVSI